MATPAGGPRKRVQSRDRLTKAPAQRAAIAASECNEGEPFARVPPANDTRGRKTRCFSTHRANSPAALT